MRLRMSGSKERRIAPATAARATSIEMTMMVLLRRRQRLASASRIRSVKLVILAMMRRGDSMRRVMSQELPAMSMELKVPPFRRFRPPITAGRSLAVLLTLLLVACPRPGPLTKQKVEEILSGYQFTREPVYAEVPQKVWWNARFPKDDYDAKSLRTLDNLRAAGYLTYAGGPTPDGGGSYLAKVTAKGFPVLGTAPRARGPAYRGSHWFTQHAPIPDLP